MTIHTCECGEIYSSFSVCAKCSAKTYAALKIAISPPDICKECGTIMNISWKKRENEILVRERVWCGVCAAQITVGEGL